MDEFPDAVDVVIYGTGVAESIIAASLSLCGKKVLHMDRMSQYGGTEVCARFDSLLDFLQQSANVNHSVDKELLKTSHVYDCVRQVSHHWHIDVEQSGSRSRSSSPQPEKAKSDMNSQAILKELSRVEIDIMPKIIKAKSVLIDAILKSDVSRYLEFTFVRSLYAIKSGTTDIIKIPQTRSDVFESNILTLMQKRKLTKFLEFCHKYNNDTTPQEGGLPSRTLREVLCTDYKMDSFLVDTIINTFTMSSQNVLFEEGMNKLNDILHSVNRFGPYPIMVPLYGTSDIGQGFCRMSAVFGSTYCLDCHIDKLIQLEDNKSPHKLELKLSNGKSVRTTSLITARNNLSHVETSLGIKWMSRAIYILKGSIFSSFNTKGAYESSLLVIPRLGNETPFIVLENGAKKNPGQENYYIVHVLASMSTKLDPKVVVAPVEEVLFGRDSPRTQRILSIYFNIPDFSKSVMKNSLPKNVHVLPGFTNAIDLDDQVKQAEQLFKTLYPNDPFLNPPPKPEDIIMSEEHHNSTENEDKEEAESVPPTE